MEANESGWVVAHICIQVILDVVPGRVREYFPEVLQDRQDISANICRGRGFGDIVIAEVDGEWTMKYLKKSGNSVTLLPDNPKFQPIKPKNELKIAGVVTAVVRRYQ